MIHCNGEMHARKFKEISSLPGDEIYQARKSREPYRNNE